jgi:hypothetical protein
LWFGVFTARVLFFMSLGSINCIEIIQRMWEDSRILHIDATNDFNYLPRSFNEGIKTEVEQYIKMKRDKLKW